MKPTQETDRVKQIVLASSNPGKLREFAQMFAPLGIELIAQSALGIADADEPHGTFVENALAKARHASRQARLPAMADDSGICVRALGGEPGVHSARFAADGVAAAAAAGRDSQDALNNRKLLALLRDQPDRAAHYYAAIVLVRHGDDPEPLIADGLWNGEIIDAPRGTNGFGYDPHFFLRDVGKTAAELDPEQKNVLSHRGKALRRLLARLKEEAP
ncbi:MAG: RdgB/HAM1 family non-canonical purine NTP pyrophosphatase [Betaproteobacteria bacterium]|nr:RdgB/HAM1 family non-canonical purine NTP pyrophosphatase [Betaproteobacteria bacterium]